MRTRTVAILAAIMVVLAGALVAVAWTGQATSAGLSREVAQMRADLGSTKTALAQARAETAAANAKVEALSAACCRPGVDPRTVLVTVTPAAQTSPAPSPTPSPAKPSPGTPASPRATTKPSPTASPACTVYNPVTGRCLT